MIFELSTQPQKPQLWIITQLNQSIKPMQLLPFQKQDLARAALKDGLILGWDTGLGKTWAMFLWALLKVGFVRVSEELLCGCDPNARVALAEALRAGERLRPKAPVLIIAPGDLHEQIAEEALTRFGLILRTL